MKQNTTPLEKENAKKDDTMNNKTTNTYTTIIDSNTFHVISQFQGTETASQIIHDLAVKRILYDDPISLLF